jgi:PIN domain nuclease of toxin-antitoxin system
LVFVEGLAVAKGLAVKLLNHKEPLSRFIIHSCMHESLTLSKLTN